MRCRTELGGRHLRGRLRPCPDLTALHLCCSGAATHAHQADATFRPPALPGHLGAAHTPSTHHLCVGHLGSCARRPSHVLSPLSPAGGLSVDAWCQTLEGRISRPRAHSGRDATTPAQEDSQSTVAGADVWAEQGPGVLLPCLRCCYLRICICFHQRERKRQTVSRPRCGPCCELTPGRGTEA